MGTRRVERRIPCWSGQSHLSIRHFLSFLPLFVFHTKSSFIHRAPPKRTNIPKAPRLVFISPEISCHLIVCGLSTDFNTRRIVLLFSFYGLLLRPSAPHPCPASRRTKQDDQHWAGPWPDDHKAASTQVHDGRGLVRLVVPWYWSATSRVMVDASAPESIGRRREVETPWLFFCTVQQREVK
jgi:hypothetical protein